MPIGRSNSSLVFHRNFRRISRGFELGAIAHVLFVSSLKTLVESRDCLISSGSRLELGCICACAHLSGVPPSHSRRRNGGRSSTTQSPWEHQTPKTKKSLSFFSGIVPVFDLCMVRTTMVHVVAGGGGGGGVAQTRTLAPSLKSTDTSLYSLRI